MPTQQQHSFGRLGRLADIIIGSLALLAIAVLLYFAYHHDRYIAGAARILIFVVVPAATAVTLLLSLRASRRIKLNLALTLMSVVVALYGAEFCLTFLAYLSATQSKPSSQQGVDTRSKFEVIEDSRRRGVELYPAIFPSALLQKQGSGAPRSVPKVASKETLPLSGVSDALTVLCNESGSYVLYHSDKHGFRNPEHIWDLAQLDIATVGDSYTQGWCVPCDDTFVGRIRQTYPATLNLGMMGDGPLLILATLREYLTSLKPAVVLWFHSENDLANLEIEARSPVLLRYLQDPEFRQHLRDRQTDLDMLLKEHVDQLEHLHRRATVVPNLKNSLGLIHLRNLIGFAGWKIRSPDTWLLFEQALKEARTTVHSWGGELYFVYLPGSRHYFRSVRLFNPASETHRRVVSLVAQLDIPVVDIHEAFRRADDPRAFFPRLDRHYNSQGHQKVAEEVLEHLRGTRSGVVSVVAR